MAIAFDTVGQATLTSTTSLSWSHTFTGANGVGYVGTVVRTNTCSGVTWNGVSMTQIQTAQAVGGSNDSLQLWELIGIPAGAATIVASNSGGASLMQGGSVSYTGAKQTGQPDSSSTQAATTVANLTMSTTTVADNSWAIMVVRWNSGGSSAGAGTTQRLSNSSGLAMQFYDGNGPKTPAGSYSLNSINVNSPSADLVVGQMASFSPAAVVSVSSGFFMAAAR